MGIFSKVPGGIRRIRSSIPIRGYWGTFKMTLSYIFSVEVMYHMEKKLTNPEVPIETRIPLELKILTHPDQLTNEEIERVESIRGFEGVDQFKQRFNDGHIMFGLYTPDTKKLAGFVWFELPPVMTSGSNISDDMAFTYDAWTFEDFRGKRVFPNIQQNIFKYTRENHTNVQRILTLVAVKNKPSAYQDQRAGYIILGLDISMFILGFSQRIRLI